MGNETESEDDNFDDVTTQAGAFGAYRAEYNRKGSSSYDTGHEFSTERTWLDVNRGSYLIPGNPDASSSTERNFWYKGPVTISPSIPAGGHGLYPTVGMIPSYSVNQGILDGTRAINATIPTHPVAGLGVGLAELAREGIPSMIGHSLRDFRSLIENPLKALGGEHLNLQFGWAPLFSEIRDAAQVAMKTTQLLQQFERDSGRLVRRRFEFPELNATTSEIKTGAVQTNGLPLFFGQAFSVLGGPMSEVHRSSIKRWFSGAYTYHYAMDDHSRSRVAEVEKRAQHLLGLRLTPEVLWNLAPWSWLSDWVSNIGINISNATRFQEDGLVIKYGYIMVTQEVSCTRVLADVRLKGTNRQVGPLVLSSGRIKKTRTKATPYGFGIDTSSFTGRQWGILGALGMTKSPNSLRIR